MFVKPAAWTMAILVAAVTGSPAQAESFKDKSGVTYCTPGTSEEIMKRPDGTSVRKTTGACISTTDLPFPFDYRRAACNGTQEIAADGKPVSQRGYCEVVSTKGDRHAYWYNYDFASNKGLSTFMTGSGAYTGIKGEVAYKFKAVFPGGGAVIDWTGSWQTDGATAAK